MAAVDLGTFRRFADSAAWSKCVQRVAEPLKVIGRSFRHDVHIDGRKIRAVQTTADAAEHEVIDTERVETLAERSDLLVRGAADRA